MNIVKLGESGVAKAPKEMLSVAQKKDPVTFKTQTVVKINNSSLDIIQTCKRKAFYALERKLVSNEESPATRFGTAIHKGLETWYSQPRATRKIEPVLEAFSAAAEGLDALSDTDKRHPSNGIKILSAYCAKYADDPFEIFVDRMGPVVERRFVFPLLDTSALRIEVFGTIDCILQNKETGITLVCDHKTTSTLGSDFYNRIKPNHQYTCYVMGAQRALGIHTNLFLVNGLQVAKTKVDLARQVTQRDETDFAEFTSSIVTAVEDYLRCRESGNWPMTAPQPCTMWGGCGYRQICETPASLRENVISAMYNLGDSNG